MTHLSGIEATPLLVKGVERSTPCGVVEGGLYDPQGVERIEAGIGTSVIREAVTDAYGASTLRVPHGWSHL